MTDLMSASQEEHVWQRVVRSHAASLALIALATVIVWARPVLSGFTHLRLSNPGDSNSFEFYLAWNLHSLLDGKNPFHTPALYAPDGLDLGNAISLPAVSVLVAPITAAFGPTAAYNSAFLLAIFASAAAIYLLARELSGSQAGAVLAGLLMVVSPYHAGHALGHLNMMWIAGLPFVCYLTLRYIRGRLVTGWIVGWMAITVAFTIGASSELFVTQCVFGAIALGTSFAIAAPDVRRRLLQATIRLAIGGLAGLVLALPIIAAALSSGVPETPFNPPWMYSADLTNLVAPTDVILIGDSFFASLRSTWLGNSAENTAYIPAPLLLIAVGSAALIRQRAVRGLLLFGTISLVLSFGPYLNIAGNRTIPMPWGVTTHVPALDHALPVRFSAFTFMAIALMVAVACAQKGIARWVAGSAAALGIVLAIPDLARLGMPVDTSIPRYVASGDIRDDVDPGENVLVLPPGQWGPGMRWLSAADFEFVTPTGNGGGAEPPPALKEPTGWALFAEDFAYDWNTALPEYTTKLGIETVLVDPSATKWLDVMETAFPGRGRLADGVWVFDLAQSPHKSNPTGD